MALEFVQLQAGIDNGGGDRTANFLPGFPAHPQSVVVFGAMLNLQIGLTWRTSGMSVSSALALSGVGPFLISTS